MRVEFEEINCKESKTLFLDELFYNFMSFFVDVNLIIEVTSLVFLFKKATNSPMLGLDFMVSP